MYNYAIYGGGPTGLVLSYIIALNGYKVVLIEKEKDLGGCWRTEWLEDKYLSEHSPRVLFPNDNDIIKILDHFGMDMDKELSKKSPSGTGVMSIIKYMLTRLSLLDILKLAPVFLFGGTGDLTVTEWCDQNNISKDGVRALRTLSVVLANSPDKLLMSELFGDETMKSIFSVGNKYSSMSQFVNHDKWIQIFESKLIELGVTIYKNTELLELKRSSLEINKITKAILKSGEFVNADNHILTLPPVAFYNLLKGSQIENNWMPIDKLKDWTLDSYYASIGFQLHFKEKQPFPDEWCWSCENDYDLIVVNVSKYTDMISKDPNIKSVWSCTVVSTGNNVEKWGKTINQLELDTILKDCLEILKVNPYKVTVYPGLHKQFGEYVSRDTSFSLGKTGVIPYKGKAENLYTVGPHNISGITSIGKASKVAIMFCDFLKLVIPKYLKKSFFNFKVLIIFLIIFLSLFFIFFLS
jgi:hypothetical protein